MDAFDTSLRRRPLAVGLKIAVILFVLLVIAAAWVGAYLWAKHTGQLKRVEHVVGQMDYTWPAWMGNGAKKATYQEPPAEPNHVAFDPRDAEMKRLQRELDEQRRLLEALRQQKATPPKTPPKPVVYRPMLFVQNTVKEDITPPSDAYPFSGFIPCQVETILNSEIEGLFTVKTRGNLWDTVSGHQLLIPQGRRVVAKDESASLLLGNERIPTFSLSLEMPDGSSLDLGNAPIMDQSGTNGLTGKVDNHVWRLVWTSIFIGGLRGGQQMVSQELAQTGLGPVASGIASQGSQVAQQRLGRAQDTRPTIEVAAGSLCNILVPKTLHLPAVARR
jgi:hypothetical protein